MLRDHIARNHDNDPHFRWRGESVTRIENLSDIVFALAFGMLVSASTPPTSYNDLLDHLWQIIPVVAGFTILVVIWNSHFVFFRRYALANQWVVFLNACLLLVVLFIAYPLRFIFDGLFGFLLGLTTGDWSRIEITGMDFAASGHIVGIFALGYAVVFLIVALMYGHALRKKDLLDLNDKELALTKRSVWQYRASVLIALAVGGLALLSPLGPYAAILLSFTGFVAYGLYKVFPFPEASEPASETDGS